MGIAGRGENGDGGTERALRQSSLAGAQEVRRETVGGGCPGLGPLGEMDDPGACFSGGRSLLTCAKSSSVTQNRVGLEKSWEDPEGCSQPRTALPGRARVLGNQPVASFLASMEDDVELVALSLWGVDVREQ